MIQFVAARWSIRSTASYERWLRNDHVVSPETIMTTFSADNISIGQLEQQKSITIRWSFTKESGCNCLRTLHFVWSTFAELLILKGYEMHSHITRFLHLNCEVLTARCRCLPIAWDRIGQSTDCPMMSWISITENNALLRYILLPLKKQWAILHAWSKFQKIWITRQK